MNKYTVRLSGHGVESVFVALNEDSFSFWFQKQNEEDFTIEEYLCNPEDFEGIPEEFNFLIKDGEASYWDDHEDIFCHLTGPDLDSCFITVDKVEDDGSYEEILCEKFQDFIEKHENIIEHLESEVQYNDIPEQIMECNSYEKGTIFGDTFQAETFDPKLLKICIAEGPNGVDYLCSVHYNGIDLDNTEYCVRGKGMVVNVWEK
jgi:hypothetical protein